MIDYLDSQCGGRGSAVELRSAFLPREYKLEGQMAILAHIALSFPVIDGQPRLVLLVLSSYSIEQPME
jgi:hypothetical protein